MCDSIHVVAGLYLEMQINYIQVAAYSKCIQDAAGLSQGCFDYTQVVARLYPGCR